MTIKIKFKESNGTSKVFQVSYLGREEELTVTSFEDGIATVEPEVTVSVISYIRLIANLTDKRFGFEQELMKAYNTKAELKAIRTNINGTATLPVNDTQDYNLIYEDWKRRRERMYREMVREKSYKAN